LRGVVPAERDVVGAKNLSPLRLPARMPRDVPPSPSSSPIKGEGIPPSPGRRELEGGGQEPKPKPEIASPSPYLSGRMARSDRRGAGEAPAGGLGVSPSLLFSSPKNGGPRGLKSRTETPASCPYGRVWPTHIHGMIVIHDRGEACATPIRAFQEPRESDASPLQTLHSPRRGQVGAPLRFLSSPKSGGQGVEDGCRHRWVTSWIPAPRLREDKLRGNDTRGVRLRRTRALEVSPRYSLLATLAL